MSVFRPRPQPDRSSSEHLPKQSNAGASKDESIKRAKIEAQLAQLYETAKALAAQHSTFHMMGREQFKRLLAARSATFETIQAIITAPKDFGTNSLTVRFTLREASVKRTKSQLEIMLNMSNLVQRMQPDAAEGSVAYTPVLAYFFLLLMALAITGRLGSIKEVEAESDWDEYLTWKLAALEDFMLIDDSAMPTSKF